jgi:hypothetical protein
MRGIAAVIIPVVITLHGAAQQPPAQQPHRISSPISFYDDADTTAPGVLNISQGLDYDRVSAGKDISVPSSDFSVGVNRWLDLSASLGYARSQFETIRVGGMADTYVGGKAVVLQGRKLRPAIAIKPTFEVLGAASTVNNLLAPSRVNFMLPVMVQESFESFRAYYTVGYLTRGVFFQSLAYEANRWSHVTPTAIVSHSRLTRELGLVSGLGLNRSRTDLTGGIAVNVTPKWTIFGSAGRSVGRLDVNSSVYQFSGGISLNLRLWGAQ